jgi:transposase-like protein
MVKLPSEVKHEKKGTRRLFNPAFKKDAETLVSKKGYSISKIVKTVGTTANNLRR